VDQPQGQLSLFDAWLEPAASDHSRSLEVYDALPKFSLIHERETEQNLREWNNVVIGQHTVRVTMSAAILPSSAMPGDRDRPVRGRVIFPGAREELVERALRKMAVQRQIDSLQGLDQLGNRIVSLDFTLFRLRQELADAGHHYKISEIREALDVLRGCHYSIEGLQDDWLVGKGPYPLLYIEYRRKRGDQDGQRSYYRATFPPIASRAILSGAWHPINYGRLMQLRLPLARWIAERMNMSYRQAEKHAALKGRGYYLYLSRVLAESGIVAEPRLRDNAQRVREALTELQHTGFLSLMDAYLEEPSYEQSKRRGRPTLRDIRWTLYPSNTFSEEIIAGNTAMLRLRQRTELQGQAPTPSRLGGVKRVIQNRWGE
jgi:hypothetical protein